MKPNRTEHSANWMRKKNKIKEITLWTRKNELLVCILCALNRAVSFSIESWIKYTESTNTQIHKRIIHTHIQSCIWILIQPEPERNTKKSTHRTRAHTEGKTNKIKSYRTKKKLNWNAHIPKGAVNTNVSIHIAHAFIAVLYTVSWINVRTNKRTNKRTMQRDR